MKPEWIIKTRLAVLKRRRDTLEQTEENVDRHRVLTARIQELVWILTGEELEVKEL